MTGLLALPYRAHATTTTEPAHGAAALGTSRYSVPSNAHYVSPGGNDAAAGTLGSPWRTLTKAISASASGATIVMRGGTYRESDTINNKTLTIENYPGETVWLSGSVPVTSWVKDGTAYRSDGWTHQFQQGGRSDLIDPKYPLATYPDQVFVDGASQTQVASRAAVTVGTFYVDYATKQLFLGTNPAGHSVEASAYTRALVINHGNGTVVRGIGVERYANHPNLLGAVLGNATGLVFQNDVFRQNASVGLSIVNANATVDHDTITDNGEMGLHANNANGLTVTNSLLQHNDTEHFLIQGAEGNLKVTNTSGITVTNNVSQWSVGRGMWFDIDCINVTVARNIVSGNGDRGIQFERSTKGLFAGNLIVNNVSDGLSIIDGSSVDVYNNTFWHNTRSVYVIQDNRQSDNAAVPSNVSAVQIRNNIVDYPRPNASQLFAAEDTTRSRTAKAMGVTLDDDAYAQQPSNAAWWFGWANYPQKFLVFSNLSSFVSSTGQEKNGVGAQSGSELIFTNPGGGDFQRRPVSFITGRLGTALPTNVAGALGVAAGVKPALGSPLTSSAT